MNRNSLLHRGIFFALITACLSGVAIFFSKMSVAKIDPLILATCRNLVVGALFSFLLFMRPSLIATGRTWTKKTVMKLMLIGVAGGGIPFYLFFTGLQMTSAVTANYIHKSLFIWVSVFGFFFLRERMNIVYWIAYAGIVISHFVLTAFTQMSFEGEMYILAATLLWSAENVFSKKLLQDIEPDVLALFRMGIGGLTLFIVTFFAGKAGMLLQLDLTAIVTIGIGAAILFGYNFFWYRSLASLPASLATLILSFSVVVGHVLNGTFAGVTVSARDWQIAFIISCAVGLVVYFSNKFAGTVVIRKTDE